MLILQDILGTIGRRLTEEIRDRRALATSVGPSYSAFSDTGAMGVFAATPPARVNEVLDLVLAEIRRLRAGEVSDEDVRPSVRAIAGPQALGDEFNSAQVGRAIGEVADTLESYQESLARLRLVRATDV